MKIVSRMALAEVASVLARREQAHADEGAHQNGEDGDREGSSPPSTPAHGQARFQQPGIQEPDYQRPRLGRIPGPEMAPGSVGPERSGDNREAQHEKAPTEQSIVDAVELFEAGGAAIGWQQRAFGLEASFIDQVNQADD